MIHEVQSDETWWCVLFCFVLFWFVRYIRDAYAVKWCVGQVSTDYFRKGLRWF